MIKIIFIDIDGTLINDDLKVTPKNYEWCVKAQEDNVIIVINSGRNGLSSKNIAKLVNIDQFKGYVIANDGSEIWSFKENKWIYLNQMNIILVNDVYDWLINYSSDLILNFSCINDLYLTHLYKKWEYWFKDLKVNVNKFKNIDSIQEPVSKIIVILKKYWEKEEINKFILAFENKFPDLSVVHYHTNVISIGKKNVNKGSAIEWLCQYLNINIEDSVGIGDSFNDIPMLETVGNPVVMKNASHEVKNLGKLLVSNNNDSGVAEAIMHYLKK